MKKDKGILTRVNEEDISLLNSNPDSFWKDVKEIGEVAFPSSENLVRVEIPGIVETIQGEAFSFCQFIKEVKLNGGIKKIYIRAFQDCSNLEKINIPSSVEYMGHGVFMSCSNLQEVTIEEGVYDIPFSAFYNCRSLKSMEIPGSVNTINISAFANCIGLKEVKLHEGLVTIDYHAFENCNHLEKIDIPNSVKSLDNKAFEECISLQELSLSMELANSIFKFDYLNFETVNVLNNGRILLLGEDKNVADYENVIATYEYEDIQRIYASFPSLDIRIFLHDDKKMQNLLKKSKYFYKLGLFFPCELLDTYELFEKYTNKNFKMVHALLKTLDLELDEEQMEAFYKLGISLGLLEDSSVTINIGNKKIPVNVMAQEWLQRMFNKGNIDKCDLRFYYSLMLLDEYNEEFSKFMVKKNLFEDIRKEEISNHALVGQIYRWYKARKELVIVGENKNNKLPSNEKNRYKMKVLVEGEAGVDKEKWENPTLDMFVEDFADRKITLIPEGYEELADYLEQFSYRQKHFDKAVEIDRERIQKNVKDHILNVPIKEEREKYAFEIDNLRSEILQEATDILDTQMHTFTYEMLSKSSKENYAIGLLATCCAILYGAGGGAQRGMIIDENMQPLVIRDHENEIIAFGIVYVNRKEGYAVVNNLEVNVKYKLNPLLTSDIYDKAIQGIEAFVIEYNKENPSKPIDIVTCGTSPTWACVDNGINYYIKQNRKVKNFPAPDFDDFKYAGSKSWSGDWHREQFVIYESKQRGQRR